MMCLSYRLQSLQFVSCIFTSWLLQSVISKTVDPQVLSNQKNRFQRVEIPLITTNCAIKKAKVYTRLKKASVYSVLREKLCRRDKDTLSQNREQQVTLRAVVSYSGDVIHIFFYFLDSECPNNQFQRTFSKNCKIEKMEVKIPSIATSTIGQRGQIFIEITVKEHVPDRIPKKMKKNFKKSPQICLSLLK